MLKSKKEKRTFNPNKVIKRIKEYDVVSFDVFDTLVKRDSREGKQVFFMMESRLLQEYPQIKGFAEKRVVAERKARKRTARPEITLDEIYEILQASFPKEVCDFMKSTEVDFEKALCHTSVHMKIVYDYCLKSRKKIILISDMYLPKAVIEDILKGASITGYHKLYLSSEDFVTKEMGELYDLVIDDLGLDKKDLIHVGDNKKSDFVVPIKKGIDAVKIPHVLCSNIIFNEDDILSRDRVREYQALSSFIDNHYVKSQMNDDYFFRIGYETEGPLLYGFSRWLDNAFKKNRTEKVFFLSRDGQIMQKAYNAMIEKPVDNCYMFASRRAYIVPTLWNCRSLEEAVSTMFFPRLGTVDSFIKKMGLQPKEYETTIKKFGYKPGMNYTFSKLFLEEGFNKFFDEIWEDIYSNSKREFELLVKYLNQEGFTGKVAVVDIGWNGNMQKALKKVCALVGIQAEISGFYIGLNPNARDIHEQIDVCGYLFQPGKNERYFELQRNFTAIFEMMFTADHGSVKKFEETSSGINTVFEDFEYGIDVKDADIEFKAIQDIQSGALKFIDDVKAVDEFTISWTPEVVFQNLVLLGNAPDGYTAKRFGNLRRLEDTVTYIAKPNTIGKYVTNPKQLKKDFQDNPWTIGMFKRLLKVSLPYYECYTLLRKGYLLWKKR